MINDDYVNRTGSSNVRVEEAMKERGDQIEDPFNSYQQDFVIDNMREIKQNKGLRIIPRFFIFHLSQGIWQEKCAQVKHCDVGRFEGHEKHLQQPRVNF